MALTITEATAVNRLLDVLLRGGERGDGYPPTDAEQLRGACDLLAGKASRVLMAGWSPDRVAAAWDARPSITAQPSDAQAAGR